MKLNHLIISCGFLLTGSAALSQDTSTVQGIGRLKTTSESRIVNNGQDNSGSIKTAQGALNNSGTSNSTLPANRSSAAANTRVPSTTGTGNSNTTVSAGATVVNPATGSGNVPANVNAGTLNTNSSGASGSNTNINQGTNGTILNSGVTTTPPGSTGAPAPKGIVHPR